MWPHGYGEAPEAEPVVAPTFLVSEVDLMRRMFGELWDDMRHRPSQFSGADQRASETLYSKLVRLGAV